MDGDRREIHEALEIRIQLFHLADRAIKRGHQLVASVLRRAIEELDIQIGDADLHIPPEPVAASMLCRAVNINGNRRKIHLERDFWVALDQLASDGMVAVDHLCERAVNSCRRRDACSPASAIRIFVLHHYAAEIRVRSLATIALPHSPQPG